MGQATQRRSSAGCSAQEPASAASSDLALPEGSCTELPRGPSLCSARGSSVQDASGWETTGNKPASQPLPMHSTNWVIAPSRPPPPPRKNTGPPPRRRPPPGKGVGGRQKKGPSSRAEQQAVTGFLPSAKSRARAASWAGRSADLMLPNISQHLDNMRLGRAR